METTKPNLWIYRLIYAGLAFAAWLLSIFQYEVTRVSAVGVFLIFAIIVAMVTALIFTRKEGRHPNADEASSLARDNVITLLLPFLAVILLMSVTMSGFTWPPFLFWPILIVIAALLYFTYRWIYGSLASKFVSQT